MTTRIVGGTVTAPNGVALSSVPVVIELVLAEAFVVTGSLSLAGTLKLQTAADGTWSTPLQCNDDLTPVGTLYQVTEKIPAQNGGAKVYLIQVLTGLPSGPVNQVLNLIVPAAVPVGGTYAPVGSGPQGIQGVQGPPGSVVEPTNAALNARTKVEGLPVYVTAEKTWWVWNGTRYELDSYPSFVDATARQNSLVPIGTYPGQANYLKTNLNTEGPEWRNSAGSATKAWNMPWGYIDSINGAVAGGVLSATAATVLTLPTVSLIRRRRYILSGYLRAISMAANGSVRGTIAGVAPPAVLTNTTLTLDIYVNLVAAILGSLMFRAPFTVSVDGTYNIGLALATSVGAGSYWTDSGGYLSLEDNGPAGAPV